MSDIQWSVGKRPKKLADIVGNADTKKVVKEYLELQNSHALLITGPSGCGKTTLAKLIARRLSGGHPTNIIESNFGADGGKDEARALIEGSRFMPPHADGKKVFICEEAHGLTRQGTMALLRPVEEPPHNFLVWIFLTDRPWMLDVALSGRCRKFPIEVPTEEELAPYLYQIVREEKALRHLEQEERRKACLLIARYSSCVPREAVQLLQNAHDAKVADFSELKKFVISARSGGDAVMDKVAAAILALILDIKGNGEKRVTAMVKLYASVDPIGLLNRMLYSLHALLLFALAGKPNYIIRGIMGELKGAKPSVEHMSNVLITLGRVRQGLKEIVIDPSTVILPTLIDLLLTKAD